MDRAPLYENGQFYKWINKKFSEKEIMSDSELAKYIADSKTLVEKFVLASSKSYYHCPYDVYAYPPQETCFIGTIGSFADLVSIHAIYALRNNDINRAQILVTSLLDVGQIVAEQKSPFTFVDFLAGKQSKRNGGNIEKDESGNAFLEVFLFPFPPFFL